MGMFDTIHVKRKLPLNKELSGLDIKWSELEFQTKDLDNSLANYTITKTGKLVENVREFEYVHYTEEEKKSKDRKPWDLFKAVKTTKEYDQDVKHHGVIIFYTSVDYTDEEEFWVEFKASFTHGKLDKMELFKFEKQKSRKVYHRECDEKRKLEEQKLWNRTKRILRYIGWRWFWNKMSRSCYNLSRMFGKLQFLIIRHLM